MIFTFGSNEAGIHGAGAAKTALEKHHAQWGMSYGHYGNSFAIPTKDQTIKHTLALGHIERYVDGFISYAIGHPEWTFKVTRLGCGLAGLHDEDVAPLFYWAPVNCHFDSVWQCLLGDDNRNYWGTF